MSNLNNLAIELTKKIEATLVSEYLDREPKAISTSSTSSMSLGKQPTYYHIRESILEVLKEYLGEFSWRVEEHQGMIDHLSPGQYEDFLKHNDRKLAAELVGEVVNNKDFFHTREYRDGYDRYRSKTRSIIVVKTGLVNRRARK